MRRPSKKSEARSHGKAAACDAEWERAFYEKCEPQPKPAHREIIEAEIDRLAQLSLIDYERERRPAAERLKIRPSVLDGLVKAKRPNDDDDGQGRAVRFADIEPWSDPVDGDMLADTSVAVTKKYVVLGDEQADTIAFWNLHTWLVNEFYISPRLAITSPTKGCGKTTVLRLLNIISRRPKRTGSISPPALFRVVEMYQPTVLLDETEKYVEHGSDLHALLNEGHCKGASIMRVLGEKQELREFGIYGAAAFARNGSVPDDLDQRSIVIELQRRKADEPLEELREDRCAPLIQLARMCARWAEDHACDLRGRDPAMGDLINRGADNWRPLIAIADVIGGEWPERIRVAARRLAPREPSSYGVVLLGDIKATFTDPVLFSSDLADTLAKIEGRPWAEWGRSGKPISPNQIAKLLKEYKIYSGTVRSGDRTAKGYYLSAFAEAFERYLGPHPPSETSQRHKPTATGTSEPFRNVTQKTGVTDRKCEKPPSNGHCDGVTDGIPPVGGNGGMSESSPPVCQHCGGPATPNSPVQLCAVEGETFLLHRACQAEWQEKEEHRE